MSSNQPPRCCSWWCRPPGVGPRPLTAAREPVLAPRCEQEREAGLPAVRSRTQSQQNSRANRGEARGTARPRDTTKSRNEQAQPERALWCRLDESLFFSLLLVSLQPDRFYTPESRHFQWSPFIGPLPVAFRQSSSRGRSHHQHRSDTSWQAYREY